MQQKSARRVSSRSKSRGRPELSAATFALGEKLVAELNLIESTDTLARWMAHYIAELMVRAKQSDLPKRDEAQRLCAGAILDLWAQVRAFPAKRKVFKSIDRVIETIDSLHPDGEPHYRNELWRSLDACANNEDGEVEKLLTTALGIDGAARNLIHHILAHASRLAGRESTEWLELAQNLSDEDPLTELRIRIVSSGRNEAQLENYRIEQLEKRIAQLEYFSAAAQALKTSLVESLTTAKAVSHALGEKREEPNT